MDIGFGTWAIIFWSLRHRGGPVTFVERQVAHVWGQYDRLQLLFAIEMMLGLPVLTLSPVLALFSGMVFLIKGGILSGLFYFPARGTVFDRGIDGPLAQVWPDNVRCRFGGRILRTRPSISPSPSCAAGPRGPLKEKTQTPVNPG